MVADRPRGRLPVASSVLAVCAHPDDESFGLGAVLDRFVADGASVSVLCFTHGEASTLGVSGGALHEIRAAELAAAAAALGIGRFRLLEHPDGALASVPLEQLAAQVRSMAAEVGADLLVVFDDGGITGHPDHCRATEAALAGAPNLPALAWSLPRLVADELNHELATGFVGRHDDEIDLVVTVDREAQRRAIAEHTSQCADNPVLWRRLELLGDCEALRWLRPSSAEAAAPASMAGTTADVSSPIEEPGGDRRGLGSRLPDCATGVLSRFQRDPGRAGVATLPWPRQPGAQEADEQECPGESRGRPSRLLSEEARLISPRVRLIS